MSKEGWGQREDRILQRVSRAFLLFVHSLWVVCSLTPRCLRQGGQRWAVALAGQRLPGLASYLFGHPYFSTVGIDSYALLPVSASLAFGEIHQGTNSGDWSSWAKGKREFVFSF